VEDVEDRSMNLTYVNCDPRNIEKKTKKTLSQNYYSA